MCEGIPVGAWTVLEPRDAPPPGPVPPAFLPAGYLPPGRGDCPAGDPADPTDPADPADTADPAERDARPIPREMRARKTSPDPYPRPAIALPETGNVVVPKAWNSQ
jgi:hypothetical protein